MLIHLVSTDPDNYGTVKFTSSISMSNSSIMYRINSLSFFASFSITTNDDYIMINNTKIMFPDKGKYDLIHDLNQLLTGYTVSFNDKGLIVISSDNEFTINDASHNVKMLLGLYHSTLPITAAQDKNNDDEGDNNEESDHYQITMSSIPYLSYGNVLYLTARTDMVCSVNNKEGKEESLSIAYKTNEILYPGFPVMCKIPNQWSFINSNQLNQLEFTLVDFQFHPVKLHSPLYITLELNSSNNLQ